VKHPGAVRVDSGGETTVLKVVALAEGLAPFSTRNAYIFRAGVEGGRSEIEVELSKIMDRKAPDVALAANDILYIPDNRSRRTTMNAIEKAIGFASGTASGALILGLH
jgi:polysaccharide export outer membrane protein